VVGELSPMKGDANRWLECLEDTFLLVAPYTAWRSRTRRPRLRWWGEEAGAVRKFVAKA
jgi:hypothetical protein